MSDVVISVENLAKSYRLGVIGSGTLTNDLKVWWAKRRGQPNPLAKIGQADHHNRDGETVWALRDVSFTVKQGEVLGIIGKNGAGKSTLLKILSRVTAPTSGEVKVKGRIASLLEVGTGFHPELTGRENIYLNGAILGMRRTEIDHKLDEIVDFAGVESYLDTPVKRYSSGMYVRLAFAVAAHLEPEILVVDEVLAVGDAEFQKKCLGKMGEVANEGRTVLFVSHNMAAVLSLCRMVQLIEHGSIVCSGESEDVVSKYLHSTFSAAMTPVNMRTDRSGDGGTRIVSVSVKNSGGSELIQCSDGLQISIGYISDYIVQRPTFLIGVFDNLSRRIFFLDSRDVGWVPEVISAVGVVVCTTEPVNIVPGMYSLNIAVLVEGSVADHIVGAHCFEIAPNDFFGTGRLTNSNLASCLLHQQWELMNNGEPR